MPFVSAEQLTNITQGLKLNPPVRSEFRGASDHQPHAQKITFKGSQFLLVTYNVLWPSAVPYLNGQPLPGGSLPRWFNGVPAQMGLETLPLASGYHQNRREATIIESVLTLLKNSHRVVVCLQECGATLRRALLAEQSLGLVDPEQAGFRMYPSTDVDDHGCIILWTADLNGTMQEDILNPPLSLFNDTLHIYNVHLPFRTISGNAMITERLTSRRYEGDSTSVIVAGDYNIPTMPQSQFIRDENFGTQDLIQFADFVERISKRRPHFAVHPRGFTNWAPAQNCEVPEENWDHMDNIMLLPSGPEVDFKCTNSYWTVEYH